MAQVNLESTQIYLDLVKLRAMMQELQFMMDKGDREAYLRPIITMVGECIADYTIAYDVPSVRAEYAPRVLGKFCVVRNDLRHIFDRKMVHNRSGVNHKVTHSVVLVSTPESAMLEIAQVLE